MFLIYAYEYSTLHVVLFNRRGRMLVAELQNRFENVRIFVRRVQRLGFKLKSRVQTFLSTLLMWFDLVQQLTLEEVATLHMQSITLHVNIKLEYECRFPDSTDKSTVLCTCTSLLISGAQTPVGRGNMFVLLEFRKVADDAHSRRRPPERDLPLNLPQLTLKPFRYKKR